MTKALLVPVHGNPRMVEYDGLKGIYELIGCELIESVPRLFGDQPACYVDDEGMFNQEPNRAVYIDGQLASILYGNMLFVGFDPSTGEDRDITAVEAERVVARFTNGKEAEGSGMAAIIEIRNSQRMGESPQDAKRRLKANGKL